MSLCLHPSFLACCCVLPCPGIPLGGTHACCRTCNRVCVCVVAGISCMWRRLPRWRRLECTRTSTCHMHALQCRQCQARFAPTRSGPFFLLRTLSSGRQPAWGWPPPEAAGLGAGAASPPACELCRHDPCATEPRHRCRAFIAPCKSSRPPCEGCARLAATRKRWRTARIRSLCCTRCPGPDANTIFSSSPQ